MCSDETEKSFPYTFLFPFLPNTLLHEWIKYIFSTVVIKPVHKDLKRNEFEWTQHICFSCIMYSLDKKTNWILWSKKIELYYNHWFSLYKEIWRQDEGCITCYKVWWFNNTTVIRLSNNGTNEIFSRANWGALYLITTNIDVTTAMFCINHEPSEMLSKICCMSSCSVAHRRRVLNI